ncbi:hypothetical protein EL75_4985 [Escherichia coli]|nr:hypothetical protein EL75_4985 [Escherichia coli]KGM78221.1 hypothetical protein EL80_2935 [Escherichia coli]KGM81336.1 hypothetical protein EL79_2761 [Escherichia coli]
MGYGINSYLPVHAFLINTFITLRQYFYPSSPEEFIDGIIPLMPFH